jgi:pre-mRNA-splicing helicase BRR2
MYLLPRVQVDYVIKPVAQTVLRVEMKVTPDWKFSPRWHSTREPFWLIIDDEIEILYHEEFIISMDDVNQRNSIDMVFFIPFRDTKNSLYRLVVTSDRW